MTRFLRTDDAATALRAILEENARAAADENVLIARDEQRNLHPFLRRHAEGLRQDGGKGTRVRVDALVRRAHDAAMGIWDIYNPQHIERDARFLALAEIDLIEADDPDLGELTRRARERVLSGDSAGETGDPGGDAAPAGATLTELVHAWFDAFDFQARSFTEHGLPGGAVVDARVDQPERETVPPVVAEAFDFYYRAEARDWGSVRLRRGVLGEHLVWAIYTVTDGDDAYLEVLDGQGAAVAGARMLGSELAWDDFPGRVRLAQRWTGLQGFSWEDGLSEPEDRDAAGQPPSGWTGDVQIDRGFLHHPNRSQLLGSIDFAGISLSVAQRELAVAAFDRLWNLHLRHAADGDSTELGPRRQGVLTIGPFTRETTGKTWLTADWRDIDDGSFVLYFEHDAFGLRVMIQQFDN